LPPFHPKFVPLWAPLSYSGGIYNRQPFLHWHNTLFSIWQSGYNDLWLAEKGEGVGRDDTIAEKILKFFSHLRCLKTVSCSNKSHFPKHFRKMLPLPFWYLYCVVSHCFKSSFPFAHPFRKLLIAYGPKIYHSLNRSSSSPVSGNLWKVGIYCTLHIFIANKDLCWAWRSKLWLEWWKRPIENVYICKKSNFLPDLQKINLLGKIRGWNGGPQNT
jgi:hypothetical protein